MKITNIILEEISDTKFRASFTYDEHQLRTGQLDRTITKAELKTVLRQVTNDWIVKRADDNFVILKDFFEGKEISLDPD